MQVARPWPLPCHGSAEAYRGSVLTYAGPQDRSNERALVHSRATACAAVHERSHARAHSRTCAASRNSLHEFSPPTALR